MENWYFGEVVDFFNLVCDSGGGDWKLFFRWLFFEEMFVLMDLV